MSTFLVPVKRWETAPPFVFVPSAGTTVLSLVRLARALKCQRSFHAFELTELTGAELTTATVETLADRCVEEIRREGLRGPFVLGGHCWGGIIAFEIAVRLEAAGAAVTSIVLLESLAPPHAADMSDALSIRSAAGKAIDDLCHQIESNLAKLPPDQAKRFGTLSRDLVDMALRYRASRSVQAPLLLIRTSAHSDAVFQGWVRMTSRDYTSRVVPGNTFSMITPPVVTTVGALIDEEIGRRSQPGR